MQGWFACGAAFSPSAPSVKAPLRVLAPSRAKSNSVRSVQIRISLCSTPAEGKKAKRNRVDPRTPFYTLSSTPRRRLPRALNDLILDLERGLLLLRLWWPWRAACWRGKLGSRMAMTRGTSALYYSNVSKSAWIYG
jgi:hypothetical protein